MSASAMGAGQRRDSLTPSRQSTNHSPPLLQYGPVPPVKGRAEYSAVSLGETARISLMVAPRGRGTFAAQFAEVFAAARLILDQQPFPMRVVSQTIFLQQACDQSTCEALVKAFFEPEEPPVTNYVLQTPCCGAALALEAWAVRADKSHVQRFGKNAVLVNYDGLQWLHVAGIQPTMASGPVYDRTVGALENLRETLGQAGFCFADVARTWFYLGGITGVEGETDRYRELNRARTDFYREIGFFGSMLKPGAPLAAYPASTGIGMSGDGLVIACTAFRAPPTDSFVLPLENPRQIPAYAYHPKYSPQSPKFSRALALLRPNYLITWISGTASIVNSESRHLGDIQKQTQQTIDNIERLIDRENFASRGVNNAGATLKDLAKIRVYIKRHEDYAACKAVCEQRFGKVPAIYAVADVCRPELLVEIEGVAFSSRPNSPAPAGNDGQA